MAAEKIVRYYRHDRNAEGRFFPGVPLRDLTQADLDALPEHVRASVEASDLYVTRPAPEPAEEGPADG
jgi:hypothetical protein